jgi:hypothetical protein
MFRRWQDVVFGILCAGVLAVAVLCVLVASGHFVSDAEGPAPPPPPAKRTPPAEKPISTPATPTVPVGRDTVPRRSSVVHVSITASRGDCWVVAHSGSQSGPVLLERVVGQGETVTLDAPRVWLELGAAGNVDVSVNGRARKITAGTTDLVLG